MLIINIDKNWPNNAGVGGSPFMEKFMEMEETPMDENEDVIALHVFLVLDENNNMVYISFDYYFLHFSNFLFLEIWCHIHDFYKIFYFWLL